MATNIEVHPGKGDQEHGALPGGDRRQAASYRHGLSPEVGIGREPSQEHYRDGRRSVRSMTLNGRLAQVARPSTVNSLADGAVGLAWTVAAMGIEDAETGNMYVLEPESLEEGRRLKDCCLQKES